MQGKQEKPGKKGDNAMIVKIVGFYHLPACEIRSVRGFICFRILTCSRLKHHLSQEADYDSPQHYQHYRL